MPPPPSEPGAPAVSALNQEAAPHPATEGGTMQMSSGPSPSTPGPTGVWGRVVALPSHHQGGPGLEGSSPMVPHPTSCGFGLVHQFSLCECSFHHHGLPQLRSGRGRARGVPPWGRQPPVEVAWDDLLLKTRHWDQAAGAQGEGAAIYIFFFFFFTEAQLMNVTLGVLGPVVGVF